jgi:hypothetical protein
MPFSFTPEQKQTAFWPALWLALLFLLPLFYSFALTANHA